MNNLNMQTVIHLDAPIAAGIARKSFSGANAGNEHFISVEAAAGLAFSDQLEIVQRRYAQAVESLGLSPQSAVFRRIFLSDVLNQADLVHKSMLVAETPGDPVAVSIVQQPPLSGAKIALLAYHIESPGSFVKQRISPQHVVIEKNGLGHLWSTRLCTGASDSSPPPVTEQTRQAFTGLIDTLSELGGTLRDHCIRTWIYLRNVDVFYQGMVDSRTELFEEQGLTADTHYIASTGIEGACAHRSDLVMMDAYSVLGMAPQQMSFLNDFDHLCATKDYNVTFERGTRIAYADRAHHFISGTASIDTAGRVVHPGDVLKQLELALTNVDALLRAGAAGLDDMMHLLVYLRDPTDYASVRQYLSARFPDLPILIVQGAVCRPDWLIEVECIAMVAHDEPGLPSF
ncbi:MAG TPA: Rid family hydrolase [Burkholderiales bacterium]|nr:Rid family hydrolase [Burkholderiales bacterium]